MKILVTGATGFIGSKLCLKLAERGYKVNGLCRDTNSPMPKHANIVKYKGDIMNNESLLHAMKDCELLFHTAALAKMWTKNKNDFYDINVSGTKNVIETAQIAGVKKIVHTS